MNKNDADLAYVLQMQLYGEPKAGSFRPHWSSWFRRSTHNDVSLDLRPFDYVLGASVPVLLYVGVRLIWKAVRNA